MRVLQWIIGRCEGKAGAAESPIGHIPRPQDLDLDEIEGVSPEQLGELLAVKPDEWKTELADQKKFFETLKPDMPERLFAEREKVAQRFGS
jgi:phosphoenolpyruvate carboxykinase (GTP)